MLKTIHEVVEMFRELYANVTNAQERINALQREVHELTLRVQALQEQVSDAKKSSG